MNLRKNAPEEYREAAEHRHAIADGGERGQELHEEEHPNEHVQQARIWRQQVENLSGRRGEREQNGTPQAFSRPVRR